jgi:hypothetical protein
LVRCKPMVAGGRSMAVLARYMKKTLMLHPLIMAY